MDAMSATGIQRQVLSMWADVFGYGLPIDQGSAWHRLLNDKLAEFCNGEPKHFSFLASGPLQDGGAAARELERGVRELGAVGGMVAANIEGRNLGEADLDEYWAAAVELNVPIFIHPTQPVPLERTARFALNQIVQYSTDTTLSVGSLMFAGVLDRFAGLRLILSHGGGTLPWLIGRFDCMHGRMDRDAMGNVAEKTPSAYLERFWYDTILHDGGALRYLAEMVGTGRLVLGSDDPFPPMDRDPLASLRAAGFSDADMDMITEQNPRHLFRLPAAD
jgi:aminocarboxymuconate-semialdehyde decarboxylase